MGSNPLPAVTTILQPPPGRNLVRPTAADPYPSQNPPTFTDAMIVRTKVFIEEQKCSEEGELDEDDARSWQWVIYADEASTSPSACTSTSTDGQKKKKTPIGVIRLVPPPHEPHEALIHPEKAAQLPKYELSHEPYVKLTRVAVLSEYRGRGLGRFLVETALRWAAERPGEIDAAYAQVVRDGQKQGQEKAWKGLALVHAQVQVEQMYERLGFVTDEALGRWYEEGIEHVGMWRRGDVQGSS
ncbi:hypothetical protein AN0626.2 [Paecilomyces variotii No. 5]|uniref:Glucosamine 6-phosphate N-acetyltransferase n=1 Tax=Byssochlamys spectabilis (strain No. 5 / NBRC 109023) TaxID=1356009 RepID=V5GBM2_BYSSN|nr:hypothetical protein AN0626.2 [Paecilomyces variotii No. 5]